MMSRWLVVGSGFFPDKFAILMFGLSNLVLGSGGNFMALVGDVITVLILLTGLDSYYGVVTVLESNVTAVCASALPLSVAPVFNTIAV
jgi:hypothetical protein